LRKCVILTAMLAMLLLAAPVAYASWPYSQVCEEEHERLGGHVPGEFIVTYESVEAMWAAPHENVKRTSNDWGPLQCSNLDGVSSVPSTRTS
jgi:hypothetical protein